MEPTQGTNHFMISASRKRQDKDATSIASSLKNNIDLRLSQWNGLQMAVHNKWGGCESVEKSHQLASDIFSWFAHSKGNLHVEDLENLLHESLLFSFNTEIEDGSIDEIAEQLMMVYEECLHGIHHQTSITDTHEPMNYNLIAKLRNSVSSFPDLSNI